MGPDCSDAFTRTWLSFRISASNAPNVVGLMDDNSNLVRRMDGQRDGWNSGLEVAYSPNLVSSGP